MERFGCVIKTSIPILKVSMSVKFQIGLNSDLKANLSKFEIVKMLKKTLLCQSFIIDSPPMLIKRLSLEFIRKIKELLVLIEERRCLFHSLFLKRMGRILN